MAFRMPRGVCCVRSAAMADNWVQPRRSPSQINPATGNRRITAKKRSPLKESLGRIGEMPIHHKLDIYVRFLHLDDALKKRIFKGNQRTYFQSSAEVGG